MSTLLTFLKMNGYGFYIWSSYGVVISFLALQWAFIHRRWKKTMNE